jgi:predicted RNA-binding Zn ribbon-like protein
MTTEQLPRIVGGHLGLDLVNTVAPRTPDAGEHEDYLATPADLLLWAHRVQVLSDAEAHAVAAVWAGTPGADEQALHVVWEIREATYRILAAALSGQADRVSTLNALDQVFLRWTAALARGSLAPAGVLSAVVGVPAGDPGTQDLPGVARIRYGDVPAWLVVDRLAAACVDLLQTVEVRQLKACPVDQGGCGWLFVDRSRNGSRRWCTMDDCGAHAKARRLTERRRRSATSKPR